MLWWRGETVERRGGKGGCGGIWGTGVAVVEGAVRRVDGDEGGGGIDDWIRRLNQRRND